MPEWFLIGSVPFWVLTVLVIASVMLAIEKGERSLLATVCIAIYLVAIHWLGNAQLVHWAKENLVLFLSLIPGYFVAGSVWCVFKWLFFTRKLASEYEDQYRNAKRDFFKVKNLELRDDAPIPEELKAEWKRVRENSTFYYEVWQQHLSLATIPIPQAREHKARILTWMTFWPTSLVWTLLNDPIRAISQQIYLQIQSTLQNISNRAFANIKDIHKSDAT